MEKLAFAVLSAALLTISCKKKATEDMNPSSSSLNINYPAAFVVNGSDKTISVIKLADNTVTGTIDLTKMNMPGMGDMSTGVTWPHHIYLNPSKKQLAVGVPGMDLSGGHSGGMGMTAKIALVDASNGAVSKVLDLPVVNHNAAFSPKGDEIWTAEMQDMGKVLVYDASTYSLKKTIDVKMQPAEVTFSSDGTVAFVANGMSDTVTAIDVNTKSVVGQIAVGNDPVGAWPGSDGNMYVDNESGKSISVIQVSTLSVVSTIPLDFMPGVAAYNKQMNELWVTDPDNGKVHWWTKSGNLFSHGGSFATGSGAHAIAFTEDGRTAYITNQLAATVSVADVMNHVESKKIQVGIKPNGIVIK